MVVTTSLHSLLKLYEELSRSKQVIAGLVKEETLKMQEVEKVTVKAKVKDVM